MSELHEVDDLQNHVDHFGVSVVAECDVIPPGVSKQEGRLSARLRGHVVNACS
jgi:hypothetical protein